ncbi:MAG: c-type cytochrome [Burkholderiaceae bacterium]|nr:c-type cytochrome [Burkholderiaceae bacterium]
MRRPILARLALASAALATVAWAGPAAAQDYQARSWAASCFACHGTEGRSEGEFPALAGKSKKDLLAALQEFKAGTRKSATIMHQHAKGYTDQQLERIATYFSQQSRR